MDYNREEKERQAKHHLANTVTEQNEMGRSRRTQLLPCAIQDCIMWSRHKSDMDIEKEVKFGQTVSCTGRDVSNWCTEHNLGSR